MKICKNSTLSSSRRRSWRRLPNLRSASCRRNRLETSNSTKTNTDAKSSRSKLTPRRLLLLSAFKKKWKLSAVFNRKRENRRKIGRAHV